MIAPRQLWHDVADFVGREDLLADLDAAVTGRSGRLTGGVVVVDGLPLLVPIARGLAAGRGQGVSGTPSVSQRRIWVAAWSATGWPRGRVTGSLRANMSSTRPR